MNVKQACQVLLEFIDSCPGGETWLQTPDGEKLSCDLGYLLEGLKEIKAWAEKEGSA